MWSSFHRLFDMLFLNVTNERLSLSDNSKHNYVIKIQYLKKCLQTKEMLNICLPSNFAVTESQTVSLFGDTKEDQRSCIFLACLYNEAQLNKYHLPFMAQNPSQQYSWGENYLREGCRFCRDLAGWHCWAESPSAAASPQTLYKARNFRDSSRSY